ncbi:GNAT family N-acetyltransferase [Stomatohabitans albus]|uniref:GNAT family N-acetyltransferase n=1 Tax=Stomatohabitans albus TaxID=3110766 RepID=UPI00300C62E2
MSEQSSITITNNGSAFEATKDALSVGYIKYAHHDGYIDAYSTVVDPAHRGEGIASKLVEALVAEATSTDLRVKPTCPYIDAWLKKHPDIDAVVRL